MPPPQGSGRRYALGLRPPSPPPAGRRDRAPVVILAVLIPALVIGLGWLLYDARSGDGGSSAPDACSLLSQTQVDSYVPGAVPGGDGDYYRCPWAGTGGRLTVEVAMLPGEPARVSDAEEEYAFRRRQAGTAIVLPSLGDESFMVCGTPPGSCETTTRVGNVVFSLEFDGSPASEPASTVRALAALAVRHLEEPS
jgi:hypothetical protein